MGFMVENPYESPLELGSPPPVRRSLSKEALRLVLLLTGNALLLTCGTWGYFTRRSQDKVALALGIIFFAATALVLRKD